MMNHFFALLIILGIVIGIYQVTAGPMAQGTLTERLEAIKKMGNDLTEICWDRAMVAVDLCIKYIGLMALWLGLMKIAEDAGLVRLIALSIRPLMRLIFPSVPADHPAMGAMLMNIAANMLGLDNAATPLGLKAMKELQTINPEKGTASNAMIMFIAINTSSVTLLPFSIIAWRATKGSIDPQIIIVPALVATLFSTIGAITVTSILARLTARPAKVKAPAAESEEPSSKEE